MLFKTSYDSPIGPIIMLANDHGLLGAWYENQEHFAGTFDLEKAQTLEILLTKPFYKEPVIGLMHILLVKTLQ